MVTAVALIQDLLFKTLSSVMQGQVWLDFMTLPLSCPISQLIDSQLTLTDFLLLSVLCL